VSRDARRDPVILLARHGQTAYNRARRFQGHLPVPLDDTGREQARELAQLAGARGDIVALWCSPLARAQETAEIVAERLVLEPRPDPRFVETDCGLWTDRFFTDVAAEDPDGFAAFLRADPVFRFPGGESLEEQDRRVAAGLAAVRAQGTTPALVVCHGMVIRLALARARGDPSLLVRAVPNAALVEL
jgi:broad specificity phosphatase PhoE